MAQRRPPVLLYASTNKVYGALEALAAEEEEKRYILAGRPAGIDESQPLDFHSPYGCTKGYADQYVRDCARINGLSTIVFRQSCIYGHRQFGVEDQGWVAWFAIAAKLGRALTIFGNGKQVRDILDVDDLVRAMDLAVSNIEKSRGQIYNVGGGAEQTVSLIEIIEELGRRQGRELEVDWAEWRPGDQKIYVSDISKIREELGWEPRVGLTEGLDRLEEWINQNLPLFKNLHA